MLDAFTQRRMDRSELPDRGGYEGTLRIKAGTKGVLTIRMNAHFLLDQKWNDEYDQEFSCSWDVAIDEQGKLTISKGRKDIVPPNDNEAEFSLTALDLEEDPTAGTVGMTPVFQSYQNTDIPNISVGGEVGIGKGGAVGGQATLGNERTYPAGALAKNFLIRIQPTDIKVPEPKVEIGPITMQTHRTHDVLFEKPKQSNVSGKQENELYRWYTTLSPETRAMLRAGEGKVKLDGYASTTDKARNNRELARDRVESVKRILRDFGAKEFDDAAFGEYEEGVGEPEGEVEAQEKRKVAIEVVEAPVTIYEGDAAAGAP